MNKKYIFLFLGNLIIGIAISLAMIAHLGTDSFNTLSVGINNKLHLGIGTIMLIINTLAFLIMLRFSKENINIGTFINWFFVGYIVEYAHKFLSPLLTSNSMVLRIALLVISFFLLTMGIGMYMACSLGIAPWDNIALLVCKKYPNLTYKVPRMIHDIIALGIGFALGAKVGFATIIIALCTGPFINLFETYFKTKL
ncbi:MAG: hypothetical protein Q4A47_05830 [Erysipelotrichaceae bacterium]|nr:hypothetical protein [Erysipelotrichaceae bacterium]MDO5085699.1 hypothetical protein [Erysipelotrichaceae bacterium]